MSPLLHRAVYVELMTQLVASWRECQPSIVEDTSLLEGAQAMEACLQCMHQLLKQPAYAKDPGPSTPSTPFNPSFLPPPATFLPNSSLFAVSVG